MSTPTRGALAALLIVGASAGALARADGSASALLSNCSRYDYPLQTGSNCFEGSGTHRSKQVCNQPSGSYWQYGPWLNRANQSNTNACYGAAITQRGISLS